MIESRILNQKSAFSYRLAGELLMNQLKNDGAFPVIDYFSNRGGKPIIFAGSVRDALMSAKFGTEYCLPRDIDIGIAGLTKSNFHQIGVELGAAINRYGGYTFNRNLLPTIDLWRLEDTCGLQILRVPYSLDNVLRSFVIDLNAVAFDTATGTFTDRGCLQALHSRTIDLVDGVLIHNAEIFAAKALLLSARFSMRIGKNLGLFIQKNLDCDALYHESEKILGKELESGKRNTMAALLEKGIPFELLARHLHTTLMNETH